MVYVDLYSEIVAKVSKGIPKMWGDISLPVGVWDDFEGYIHRANLYVRTLQLTACY